MNEIIQKITKSFIDEAKSSPRMLEDLAAMERYMSESYDGRTFIELLQNADDAEATKIKVLFINNTLIVANNGRPFNENDIMSICRSGASNKKRGNNIGYRGVGFKSTTTISSEIIIYSNNTFFSFSKSVCARVLNKPENKVPTVRIPFLYSKNDIDVDVYKTIEDCYSSGFKTFFIFANPNIDKFLSELEDFDEGGILFLNKIEEVDIECGKFNKKIAITKDIISETDSIIKVNKKNVMWYIVSQNNVSIAFKYNSADGIIPAEDNESVFHCFLPTSDKTGFKFKVNADFSTDPSRKHIIQDEGTIIAFKDVQNLLADFICRIIKNKEHKFYSIITMLNSYTTFNQLVTSFDEGIIDALNLKEWVPTNNGKYSKVEISKVFSKWLDSSDRQQLLKNFKGLTQNVLIYEMYESIDNIDRFLIKLGAKEFGINEIAPLITNVDSVNLLTPKLIGKIFTYSNKIMDETWMEYCFIPMNKGFMQLSETTTGMTIHSEFLEVVKSLFNAKEISELALRYDVFADVQQKKKILNGGRLKKVESTIGARSLEFAVNKWKTPIQNCIAIEAFNGRIPKDMSNKTEEYDLISTSKDARVSYIAVKTVNVLGESFKLSEKEYSAAQKYGDLYKVYIFTTETNDVEYTVISNPIDNMHMSKVVKEWEWLCVSDCKENFNIEASDLIMDESNNNKEVNFDSMNGEQFERFCCHLLIKNNYSDVTLTKTSGDQGIDIIAYKDNIKYGFQCKCYSTDVGNDAVQEVFAGKTFYKCNVGIVLTNQNFTPSAINLAENNGVVLWGRYELLRLIRNVQ